MIEVFNGLSFKLIDLYSRFIDFLPSYLGEFINLLMLIIFVFLYVIFIWKFYRFIARKNILRLDLNQYNRYKHPFLYKSLAGIFFLLEYIIILPFLIFFWFSIFTIFLIFLTENLDVKTLLLISATVVSAIRMTSYYKQELAKDVAKLLPFTLLAISILNPNFSSVERILTHLSQLPKFFNQILIYLVFIISLEVILRFFDFIFSLFGLEEGPPIKNN